MARARDWVGTIAPIVVGLLLGGLLVAGCVADWRECRRVHPLWYCVVHPPR